MYRQRGRVSDEQRIRRGIKGGSGCVALDREREAAPPGDDSCNLPPANNLVEPRGGVSSDPLGTPKGQIVNGIRRNLMGHVEFGVPLANAEVDRVTKVGLRIC